MTALYESRKVLDALLQWEWNYGATPLSHVLNNEEYYATLDDLHTPDNHPDRMVRMEWR